MSSVSFDVVREAELELVLCQVLLLPSATLRCVAVRIAEELRRRQRVDLRLLDRYRENAA